MLETMLGLAEPGGWGHPPLHGQRRV